MVCLGQMQAFKPMLAYQQLGVLGFMAMATTQPLASIIILDNWENATLRILQLETLDFSSAMFNQPLDVQTAVLKKALWTLTILNRLPAPW